MTNFCCRCRCGHRSTSTSSSSSRCCFGSSFVQLFIVVVVAVVVGGGGGTLSDAAVIRVVNRGFTVREGEPSGTVVAQLTGRDLDVGAQRISIPIGAKLQFLQGASDRLFTITSNGQLTTAVRLDREAICNSADYTTHMEGDQCYVDVMLLVFAGDSPQKIRIPILIQDVNNNAPSWPETAITINIPEEQANYQVPLPPASDRDSAQHGVKRYRFARGRESNVFDIVGTAREPILRVMQKLDRERLSMYNFTIEAHDGSRSGFLDVYVMVTDVNDNAPVFQHSVYYYSVSEQAAVDTRIAYLVASDADAGANSQLSYSLLNVPPRCSGMFAVEPTTGILSVANPLDYERTAGCVFTVQAADHGEALQRSTATTVNITILDANDNMPMIEVIRKDGEIKPLSVLENAAVGTIIGHVCPSDMDARGQQRVECESMTAQFVLQASSTCYELRLAEQLDREAHESARAFVLVNCSDRGFAESRAIIRNLTVLIDDVNDNPPAFSSPVYYFSVLENDASPKTIGRIVATDLDASNNSEVVYTISKNAYIIHPNNRHAAFRITPQGELVATTQFDRELNDTYLLEVVASDRGSPKLSSTAAVVVQVNDRNDNAPVFQATDRYHFSVLENFLSTSPIGNVSATDRDVGANGQVRYTLSEADQMYFRINETGFIFTISDKLDREAKPNGRHFMVVMASDAAEMPEMRLTATATVTITILDKNDNRPLYVTAKNTTFRVDMTLAKVGDVIGKVEAIDADDPLSGNGAIRFYYRRNASLFSVDELTGDIRIAKPLVTRGFYSILIRAEDSGNPPLYDLISVNVIVDSDQSEATEPSRRISAETFQSILLVGTLSAVAAVLSIILMITIYFLRRQERRRSGHGNVNGNDKRRQNSAPHPRRHAPRSPSKPDSDAFDGKRGLISPQAHDALIETQPPNPIVAFSPVDCGLPHRMNTTGGIGVGIVGGRTRTLPTRYTRDNVPFKSCLQADDLSSLMSPSNNSNSHRRSASFEALNAEEASVTRVHNKSMHNICHERDDSPNWTKQRGVNSREIQDAEILPHANEAAPAPTSEKDGKVLSWFARCTPVDESAVEESVPEDASSSVLHTDDAADSGKGTSDDCNQPQQSTGKSVKALPFVNANRQGTNIYASNSSRWCVEPQSDNASGQYYMGDSNTLRTFTRDAPRASASPMLQGAHTSRASSSGTMSSTMRKKQLRFVDRNPVPGTNTSIAGRSNDVLSNNDRINNNGGNSTHKSSRNDANTSNNQSFKYDGADGDGSIGFRIC